MFLEAAALEGWMAQVEVANELGRSKHRDQVQQIPATSWPGTIKIVAQMLRAVPDIGRIAEVVHAGGDQNGHAEDLTEYMSGFDTSQY